jgi:ankyrin repeat protein
MNYYKSVQVPNVLITLPERRAIKDSKIDDVKKMIFKGLVEIDDPIDSFSKHTMLHDAVIMNREELFDFLVNQGANLMIRDQNGYTALLKAAALGRFEMVKKLIESGVDPRHIDRYGNTARDKATLYNRFEIQRYLQEMEKRAEKGELNLVNWNDPERIRRSGRYRTFLDY